MKKQGITIFMVLSIAALLSMPVFAYAGDCPGKHHKGHKFEQMKTKLELTPEQDVLFDVMMQARNDHFTAVHANLDKDDSIDHRRMRKGGRHMIHRIFYQESLKDQPDFAAAATEAKEQYQGGQPQAFNTMVDSTADFYTSLTVEQRQKMAEMKQRIHRKMKGFSKN